MPIWGSWPPDDALVLYCWLDGLPIA